MGLKFSIPIFFFGGGGGGVGVGKFGKYFFGKGFLGGIQDSKFADTSNRDYGLLILSNEMKILVLQNVKIIGVSTISIRSLLFSVRTGSMVTK